MRGQKVLDHRKAGLKVPGDVSLCKSPQGFAAQVLDVCGVDRSADHGSNPGIIPAIGLTDQPVLAFGAMLLEFLEKRGALEEGEADN